MFEQIISKYGKILDVVERLLNVICIALLSAMTLLMCYQVFMRYVMSNAPSWCEELIRYMFIYLTMLGSAAATRKGKHLVVDMLIGSIPKKANNIVSIIFDVACFAFLLILGIYGGKLVLNTLNTVSPALKIPMGYFYAAIPIGSLLLILATIEQFMIHVKTFLNFTARKEVH